MAAIKRLEKQKENCEFDIEGLSQLWEWELEIVDDLKEYCEPKDRGQMLRKRESHLKNSAETLHELGEIYRMRAIDFSWKYIFASSVLTLLEHSFSPITTSIRNAIPRILTSIRYALIRSSALINAAIVRRPSTLVKLKQDLDKLHNLAFKLGNAKGIYVELSTFVDHVLEKLNCLRKDANEILKEIEPIPEGISDEEASIRQRRKIISMQYLQTLISNFFSDTMRWISDQCIEILGNPPCRYALVGMGSLAREEITPYSDFEHIILLEDKILEKFREDSNEYQSFLEYFRWFCVIFYLIVLGLGETPIFNVSIPSLNNNQNKKYNWFYDDYTPSGISFDSMALYASHFPLGRQEKTKNKPWTTELIRPVSKMTEYLDADVDLKDGYHLANVLSNTCFVSGYLPIYNRFVGISKQKNDVRCKDGNEIFMKQLEDDLRNFNVYKTMESSLYTVFAPSFNIKQLLFRSSTLFVTALGRMKLTHIKSSSTFDIIKDLAGSQVISSEIAHELAYAVSISCEVRLKFYSKRKRQNDMSLIPGYFSFDLKHFLPEVMKSIGEESLVDYIGIVEKLQSLIRFQPYNYELVRDTPSPRIFNAYNLRLYSKAVRLFKNVYKSAEKRKKIPLLTVIVFCECLIANKEFEEALNFLQIAFEEVDILREKLDLVSLMLDCLITLRRRNDDVSLFVKNNLASLKIEDNYELIVRCYNFYALYLQSVVEDHKEALDIYLGMSEVLSKFRFIWPTLNERVCNRMKILVRDFEPTCIIGIVNCHLLSKNFERATETFEEFIKVYETSEIQSLKHLSFCYRMLGNIYVFTKNYIAARENFEKCLTILEENREDLTIAPTIKEVKERISLCVEKQQSGDETE
ncbi:unnamed protein product [Clavelina lepadiformis]|uniref:Protein-PII uridylyltransferase N-terminal domain-containing protein n=1 Tax=Clavelina lepadiformis TaxID=159417 RepID=A0ABP0FTC4_CLALP